MHKWIGGQLNSLQCRRFLRAREFFLLVETPEERRKWGESKGAGRGRGEREEKKKKSIFSPLLPVLLLPSHLPKGVLFLLSPIVLCHKIKDGGYNNIF